MPLPANSLGIAEYEQELRRLAEFFVSHYGFRLCLGAELEWYHRGLEPMAEAVSSFPGVTQIVPEKGQNQWEAHFEVTDDPVALAAAIDHFKQNSAGNFQPKPFEGQPGSGLHIHVNFLDQAGKNIFTRNGEEESLWLQYAVAGLLASIKQDFTLFCPSDAGRERFVPGFDAPTHIAWGGNNRTVAIRIPASSGKEHTRRIEHRVAGADADPYAVLGAILTAAKVGFEKQQIPAHPKIYGNAHDVAYQQPPFHLESILD